MFSRLFWTDTDASSKHRRHTERTSHEPHPPRQVDHRLRRDGGRLDRRRRHRRDRIAAPRRSGGAGVRPATATRTNARPDRRQLPGIGFTVLHNDRSGGLVLPAGPYKVSSPDFSCATASSYFTTFLNKYQGPIPGWTGKQLGYGYGTYTNNASKHYFTVKYVGAR